MATDGSFDRFTERARKVLELAREEAARFNQANVGPEHVLLALIAEGDGVAARALANLGVDLVAARSGLEKRIEVKSSGHQGEIGLDHQAKRAIEMSVDEARRLGHHYIGTEHLLLGLLREDDGIAVGVLESLGVTLGKVRTEIIKVLTEPTRSPTVRHRSTIGSRHLLPTELGADLTALGAENKLDPVIGRDAEIEGLIQALCGRLYKIPVLVGDRGVGKSAVVRGLAQRITAGEVPQPLMDTRIVLVDPSVLRGGPAALESDRRGSDIREDAQAAVDVEAQEGILPRKADAGSDPGATSGPEWRPSEVGSDRQAIIEFLLERLIRDLQAEARQRRQFEAWVERRLDAISGTTRRAAVLDELFKIFDENAELAESTILFINGLPGAGEAGPGVIGLLDWAVSGGKLRVIGSALPDDYRTFLSLPGARFWKLRGIEVKEQGVDETAAILSGLRPSFELHHHLHITDEAVHAAADLADHLLDAGSMPEKAVSLLDDACSRVRVQASLAPAPLRDARVQMHLLEGDIDQALGVGEDHSSIPDLLARAEALKQSIAQMEDTWEASKGAESLEVGERDVLLAATSIGRPNAALDGAEESTL